MKITLSLTPALLVCVVILLLHCEKASCHGRLREPPSRATMWRYGFPNPPNYNDNELNCGGSGHQWSNQKGKCGICGDPFDGVRKHEAGGKYANGIIVRTYKEGDTIDVKIQVTAPHKGWFEFRLCQNNNVNKVATKECLSQNLLEVESNGTRYHIPKGDPVKTYNLRVSLPEGATCTQCVLQWKWNTGNSWGTDPDGHSCVGCGEQEQFYACSDIAINSKTGVNPTSGPTTESPTSKSTLRSTEPTQRATSQPPPISTTPNHEHEHTLPPSGCRPRKWFKNQPGSDTFCRQNCPGICPPTHCVCGATVEPSCKPARAYASVPGMEEFCNTLETHSYCD